jgi:hypothetical protein
MSAGVRPAAIPRMRERRVTVVPLVMTDSLEKDQVIMDNVGCPRTLRTVQMGS